MEFRDLGRQYQYIKREIDAGIQNVISQSCFIQGEQVEELEALLADYVGVSNCITCANGTDALQLALMAWGIGRKDAVFVPDFTFFSSGEVVSAVGAVPVFVDVETDTFNIDVTALERMIKKVIKEDKLNPKAVIAVDLFGQPANYDAVRIIAKKYHLLVLEDAAQGFGGNIVGKMAGSFGDISTTSFFPAKPLGCYGDGGAIFTDRKDWAGRLRSLSVHGKGKSKYDNVRIGMNSRLDTLQAAVLLAKFPVFSNEELDRQHRSAALYTELLCDIVKTPVVREGYFSSWAQYTIQLADEQLRNGLREYLKEQGIVSMVYYQKPMHRQKAFAENHYADQDYPNANQLSQTVLSLPFHPYLTKQEITMITAHIRHYLNQQNVTYAAE